jgi:hypothetical protein
MAFSEQRPLAHLAVATSKVVTVHTPTMGLGRWIFLVILAVFFSGLFTSVYLWMRRPTFGEATAMRDVERTAFTPATAEEGRPMLVKTVSQRTRTASRPGRRLPEV